MHDPRRVLSFPSLLNVRDLGGCPTLDGTHTRWGSLLRADDLAQLTDEGAASLAAYGVTTVLDLRWAEEIALNPYPSVWRGARFVHHQVSLLAAKPAAWQARGGRPKKELWKCVVLEQARVELKEVLRVIAYAAPGGLLFHCVSGKDRTGIVAALLLALADVTPDAIAADYSASTLSLSGPYLERYPDVDARDILEHVRCPEEGVHHMLRYLDQHGGIRGYLEEIGLEGPEIERLRARLRA